MRSINKRELFIQAWEVAKNNLLTLISMGLFLFILFLIGSIIEGFFLAEEISGIKIPVITPQYIIYKIAFLCLSYGIFLGISAQMIQLARSSSIESISNTFNYFHKIPIKVGAMFIVKSAFFVLGMLFIVLFVGTTDININETMKIFIYDFLGIMHFDSSFEKLIELILADNMKIIALIIYIIIMIYLFIKTDFFSFFIIDKNQGIWESVKSSFIKTNGLEFELFIIYMITILITILGVLLFFIGLLFAIPFTWLILTLVYTQYLSD